jgi:hypothetical protein
MSTAPSRLFFSKTAVLPPWRLPRRGWSLVIFGRTLHLHAVNGPPLSKIWLIREFNTGGSPVFSYAVRLLGVRVPPGVLHPHRVGIKRTVIVPTYEVCGMWRGDCSVWITGFL